MPRKRQPRQVNFACLAEYKQGRAQLATRYLIDFSRFCPFDSSLRHLLHGRKKLFNTPNVVRQVRLGVNSEFLFGFARGIIPACAMTLDLIPTGLRRRYRFDERGHATAILANDFSREFDDLLEALSAFRLTKGAILTPGGGRSPIPIAIDGFLAKRGWSSKSFDIKITVDGHPIPIPTHKIDNFKNRVGVEVEWNNKTEFYDRDLNNFRLLNLLNVLSVGVIITRQSELQELFDELGKGASYGPSTTHWNKLIPKVDGGGAGQCPLLLVGMGLETLE